MRPVLRDAARAVVLDPENRVLLTRLVHPDSGEVFWTTPGGGLDPGEELETGLRRELLEETGLDDVELGPLIWTRRESFLWDGRIIDQSERFVLLRVPAFEPRPAFTNEQLRAEGVYEVRWWTLDELERSDEVVYPTRLPYFLRQLIEDGPAGEPIDVGV